ncbi:MAG: Ig-like domain-containing protein [Bacteroidota bacterium]
MKKILLFLFALTIVSWLHAQVIVQADGPGNTYELFNSKFGGTAVESPDCAHTSFGRHISEVWDNTLNKYVFVFHSHVAEDNDRCINFDRQRIEVKTYGPSPENVKGSKGETHTYRWKFKLDAGFKPSPSFTHIHQIKAGDGSDDGSPLITITPRSGSPEKLQVIHTPSSGSSGGGTVREVDLAPFKGTWVEVYEKVRYEENGTIELLIRRVNDGATLLSYSNGNLDLWRGDATFNRPKWGVYRSLNNSSYLRNEQVLFSDFCIAEGSVPCPTDVGSNPAPSVNITSPADGATFTAPASVTINANASDSNGTVTKVEFFSGSVKLGEDTSSPYSFNWTNVAAGSYTITAKATDNGGATRTSSAVTITVQNCQPVVASADDGNVAANVLDNNYNTRWSASGNPQWIQFCLGDIASVSAVQIAFYKGNERQAIFDILLSLDATHWTTVRSNVRSSGTSLTLENFSFTARNARYIRIVGHGNSVNLWNSYTEVRISSTTATSFRSTEISDGAGAFNVEFHPNPAAETLTVQYHLQRAGQIRISLVNTAENKTTIIKEEYQQPGSYQATFDIGMLPKGVHAIRVFYDGKVCTQKLIKQ